MITESAAQMYVIEYKAVILLSVAGAKKKRGTQKMAHAFCKLLKTKLEKMSVFRPSTIFMKTNELNPSLHDIHENKGGYRR
jgi:hypothetical protein